MGTDTSEVKVSACLLIVKDGQWSLTKQEQAEVYPETKAGAGYTRCVAFPGLENPSAPRKDGLWDMHGWIGAVDNGLVIIYPSDPGPLGYGQLGPVGLTSDSLHFHTITKKLDALIGNPLKPFTLDDLRAMNLFP